MHFFKRKSFERQQSPGSFSLLEAGDLLRMRSI